MKKILVIFLFATISIFLIYKTCFKKNNNILIVGEENINLDSKKFLINTFLYDDITYKELNKCIKNNDYIIIKDKKVYLNQLISKSKYIIITANKKECSRKLKLSDKNKEQLKKLLETIKKISNSEIFIINYCHNDMNYNLMSENEIKSVIK